MRVYCFSSLGLRLFTVLLALSRFPLVYYKFIDFYLVVAKSFATFWGSIIKEHAVFIRSFLLFAILST